MYYTNRNSTKGLVALVAILFVSIFACNTIESKKDYKCLSCNFYLYKNNADEYSLHFLNAEGKFIKIIENIDEIYGIRCKSIISKDSSYFVITNENAKISISIGMNSTEVNEYFKSHFPEYLELKFDLCSSLYEMLPPRQTCN